MTICEVMPREGHGSRNCKEYAGSVYYKVMPREGHGSRNAGLNGKLEWSNVMPREGHGSRNLYGCNVMADLYSSCPARGMGVEI